MVIATGEAARSNPLPSAPHQRHHAHAPESSLLPTSREVGVAVPDKNTEPIKVKGNPIAKSWAHFVAGGTGGMTAALCTAPLDVVKTRLQSDFYRSQIQARREASGLNIHSQGVVRQGLRHFTETFQILGDVYRNEGWRALFKGLGPNLSGVVPARSINFYTYGNGKRLIAEYFNHGKQDTTWVHLSAAITAGVVTSTATNPIWLIKTRLQLDKQVSGAAGKTRQYKNSFDCAMKVVREEGIRGLYRGLTASYLGVSESTLQWVLYEKMKSHLARREERRIASGMEATSWDSFVGWGGRLGAAGSAKLFAAILTYPHEVVRTRLRQRPMEGGKLKYTGLVQCFRAIWKEEGLVSMYGGLSPHLLRVVPSAAIMFGMYEVVLRAFGAES
ncbi:mitochondrial carrier domain-containing protein [Tirmania nivea]|nr:mitochondrial carrier domain-containing protein [Tirmania nivea]